MRTLTIGKSLPYLAGPAVLAYEEANMLTRLGHQVDFLTYSAYAKASCLSRFDWVGRKNGIHFHHVAPTSGNGKAVAPLLESVFLSKAIEIIKADRPDFINAHFAVPHGLIGVVLAELTDIPVVVTVHGSDVHTLPYQSEFAEVSRLVFERATHLIAVSESLRDEIVCRLGVRRTRPVHVLPPAVDLNKFVSRGFASQGETLRVLYVGRVAQEKRLDVLVGAFAKVCEQFGKVELAIVGVGSNFPALKRQVLDLKLGDKVRFVQGVFNDLPLIYQKADVFVSCSEKEGFPNTLCEAAAAGLPIVTTPVGGIPAVLISGQNCLFAQVGDSADLATKIKKILRSVELRRQMGRANRLLAEQKFDLRSRCHQLIKIVSS